MGRRRATPVNSTHDSYTIPNDWARADERLAALGASHDEASAAAVLKLGLQRGWHCLEAGAGGGSFARWLCSEALPGGRVLAVDADVRHLGDLPALGGEVTQLDLVDDELPEDAFDLVHTRLVLLHVRERDRVLARLVRALRPGGVLLVEEHDVFGTLDAMAGAYGQVWPFFRRVGEAGGLDATWARRLPELLATHGLEDVHAGGEIPFFRGGSAQARLWNLTWLQNRPQLLELGATEEQVDTARAELDDPGTWFHSPAMIRASGRRPVKR